MFIVVIDGVDQQGIPTPRLIESANAVVKAPAWFMPAPEIKSGGVWYLDDGSPARPEGTPVVRVNIRHEMVDVSKYF